MSITTIDIKDKISKTILNMEKPFKLSQLYGILTDMDILDKFLILDVLNQLYEYGLVDRTDVEDDTAEYEPNLDFSINSIED